MFDLACFEEKVKAIGFTYTIRLTADFENKPAKYLVNVANIKEKLFFPVFADTIKEAAGESFRRALLYIEEGVR